MAASKPPQAGECIPQVMIFDVGCRGIQSIGCLGRASVDCRGTLPSCFANGGGSRMECTPCLISRLIQFLAGGLAQLLD
jgi:hypothetical protein